MSRNLPIGEVIKRNRQRLKLSQTQLAAEVGVSLRTVGSWERGKSLPNRSIGALESLFEVSLDAETLGQPLDSPVADQPELFADLLEKAVPASLVGPERADPVQADPVHLAIKYSALTVDRQHRVIAVYERQLRRQAEETRQQPI